jgi:hypothetical protein
VQAVYPLHFPEPGYPTTIDDLYEGTLFNLRQWAMSPESTPGLLCAAGFTEKNGNSYFNGQSVYAQRPHHGNRTSVGLRDPWDSNVAHTGPKTLDNSHGDVTYDNLEAWLKIQAARRGRSGRTPIQLRSRFNWFVSLSIYTLFRTLRPMQHIAAMTYPHPLAARIRVPI